MREQKDRGVEGAGNWEEFLNFCAFVSSFPLLFDEEFCSSCMLFVIFFIFSFFLWARTPRDLPKMLSINKTKILRRRKKSTKLEFSGFAADFSMFFSSNFRTFTSLEARAHSGLPILEERIQKFVNTSEK